MEQNERDLVANVYDLREHANCSMCIRNCTCLPIYFVGFFACDRLYFYYSRFFPLGVCIGFVDRVCSAHPRRSICEWHPITIHKQLLGSLPQNDIHLSSNSIMVCLSPINKFDFQHSFVCFIAAGAHCSKQLVPIRMGIGVCGYCGGYYSHLQVIILLRANNVWQDEWTCRVHFVMSFSSYFLFLRFLNQKIPVKSYSIFFCFFLLLFMMNE